MNFVSPRGGPPSVCATAAQAIQVGRSVESLTRSRGALHGLQHGRVCTLWSRSCSCRRSLWSRPLALDQSFASSRRRLARGSVCGVRRDHREALVIGRVRTPRSPAWPQHVTLRGRLQPRVQTATSRNINKWSAASSPVALAGRACRQTCSWTCPPCWRRVARSTERGHPLRSSALGYASAASAAHSRVYGACAAEAGGV